MKKQFIVSGFKGTPQQLFHLFQKRHKGMQYSIDPKGNIIIYYDVDIFGEPILELDQPKYKIKKCETEIPKEDVPKSRSIPKELAAAKIESQQLNSMRYLKRRSEPKKEHDDR